MADVCDPRKTGCDCYPFPHRRNSHPDRRCVYPFGVWMNGIPVTPAQINTQTNTFTVSHPAPPHSNCKCVLTPVLDKN